MRDDVTYDRLRRIALRWSAVLAVPFSILVAQLVYSAIHHEATGAFVFFLTGIYSLVSAVVLLPMWRRVRNARPDDLATQIAQHGVFVTHESFQDSGDHPPTRW
ncbi:hypothetical protein IC607_07145 [Cellulomonas sp. JH27-2]|uniref:hypothetical protein n=1 Tax=Cellulomonas sp. JH27-2 TaxID=2774139 RepID=UPI00177B1902|nr:hypothetical protein [Cellulomonas sp. JH27-2]MBD8058739.1 hypothetical protein [Cellulomonas sp. JH27-2]